MNTTTPDSLTRWAGRSMIAISVLHMLVLGADALPQLSRWLGGQLWTYEHWKPSAEWDHALLLSSHAFWATIGSFAVPMLLIGVLVLMMADQGLRVPKFLGWALGAWVLACSLVIEPSGFPLGFIPAALLLVASRRQSRQSAASGPAARGAA